MGNCQAADGATVAIQHQDGRLEKAYWSLPASQVMAANPGHYVAVVITSVPGPRSAAHASTSDRRSSGGESKPVRYLKLLRPDDTLLIGHVYRLVSFEEVLREFASKRHVRLSRLLVKQKEKSRSRNGTGSGDTASAGADRDDRGGPVVEPENPAAAASQEEHEVEARLDTELEEVVQGMTSTRTRAASGRHRQWRPALQSIAEWETISMTD